MGSLNRIDVLLKKIDYENIDCLKNEIGAEIYFLSLKKLYKEGLCRLNNIIEKYENENIKNIIYEEINITLNEILVEIKNDTQEKENDNLSNQVMESLNINDREKIKKISVSKMKNILKSLINEDEKIELEENNINIDSVLFYQQNM